MNRLAALALPVGLALVGGLLLLTWSRGASGDAEAKLERARLQRAFAERAAAARTLPADPPDAWRAEVRALAAWYAEGLADIRRRFPKEEPRPDALAAAQAERRKELAPAEREAIQQFQAYADDRLALLGGGKYAPLASAVTEGVRLDVLAIEPGAPPGGGGPALRVDAAIWGAPRFVERERAGAAEKAQARVVVPFSWKRIAFRFADAAGKPYAEMTGAGEPYRKLVDPERFSGDFPPGVIFATWWVDLFPNPAARVELALEAGLRGVSGAERPLLFTVSLPVMDGWKLPPGAVYEAETREAAPAAK